MWFKSLGCGYTRALLNTHLSSSYISALCWSHCTWTDRTELIHKAATFTFNNPHIARATNTLCRLMKTKRKRRKIPSSAHPVFLTFWRRNYFFNFSTTSIWNVNNTGTKYVRFMKQTAFWRGKNGEYILTYLLTYLLHGAESFLRS